MSLVESRKQRVFLLCAMYFAQGVPWGFMLITLPSYLAYKYEVGDTEIGQLKAIILVPWSFKLIWAPLIDTFTIRSMGRRRPWIIGAELMMALTLLGFIGLGDLSEKLQIVLWMYFLHNCFASLQDVCTDALAVDVLPRSEQGQMNGLMWGTKLIGKGVGAWALSHVINSWGVEACVAVQIALLLLIMLVPMFILERPGERRFPWSSGQAATAEGPSAHNATPDAAAFLRMLYSRRAVVYVVMYLWSKFGPVFKKVVRAFSLTTTFVYVLFTLSKLIGPGVNEVVTNTLYTQQLNPRWTDIEFSTASGLYAMGPIIFGALAGGFLADRFGRRLILTVGFGGYGLAAMIFALLPDMWNVRWFAMTYVLSYETLNAVGSVGFLSLAMQISWTKAAATVFTTYMTLSNVSHVVGNWLAGPVREMLTFDQYGSQADLVSYNLTFWFVAVTSVVPLLLLPWVRSRQVDRARLHEDEL